MIDWFNGKRSSLQQILGKFQARCQADATFQSRLPAETRHGMALLSELITLNSVDIGDAHVGRILVVRQAIQDLRNSMAPAPAAAAPAVPSPQLPAASAGTELVGQICCDLYGQLQLPPSAEQVTALQQQLSQWARQPRGAALVQQHRLGGMLASLSQVLSLAITQTDIAAAVLLDLLALERRRLVQLVPASPAEAAVLRRIEGVFLRRGDNAQAVAEALAAFGCSVNGIGGVVPGAAYRGIAATS